MEIQTPTNDTPPVPSSPSRRRATPLIVGSTVALVALIAGVIIAFAPNHLGLAKSNGSASANDPQKTGCPGALQDYSWPHAANVTIQKFDVNKIIPAHVGDTVEVDLPSGNRWSLVGYDMNTLQAVDPVGSYSSSLHACIWRFMAQHSGDSYVKFDSQPLCKPGQACPLIIIAFEYRLAIS